ncbi:MAG: Lrp/AsnC family transcriptional regulator [Candidatus Woesearchaeota archaeon]
MNQKELLILSQFRNNARENLTTTSRRISVPISTLHDRLKKYEGTIIQRHTSILNFAELGYSLKIHMILKVNPTQKKAVKEFLKKHQRVNSVCSLSNDYDFLCEIILKDLFELTQFSEALEQFHIIDKHEFYAVEDIKREGFLTDSTLLEITPLLSSPNNKKKKNIYK